MKHLIIGAGASVAEAIALGLPEEMHPPLINDFARKTWSNYTPYPLLGFFLKEKLGITNLGNDHREVFYALEAQGKVNIEELMEFMWVNRNRNYDAPNKNFPPGFISGLRVCEAGDPREEEYGFWEDFLYHGLGGPLASIVLQGFHENGQGYKDLKVAKSIGSFLSSEDLTLNLNYDTLFEIAMQQLGKGICYLPNTPKENDLRICKPHGSLNLVSNETQFAFGQPEWLGTPQPLSFKSYSGLIPPHLNKSFDQHPIAKIILNPVIDEKPSRIIMWGVGLTESDKDLVEIYKNWAKTIKLIEVINPSSIAAEKIGKLLDKPIQHFPTHEEWIAREIA